MRHRRQRDVIVVEPGTKRILHRIDCSKLNATQALELEAITRLEVEPDAWVRRWRFKRSETVNGS